MSFLWKSAAQPTPEEADTEGVRTRNQTTAARSTEPEPVVEHTIRGREVNRVQRLQQRVRSRSRGQSPSSTPTPDASAASETAFNIPTMDEATVNRITRDAVRLALQEDREERDRQSQLVTQVAVAAALANQTSQVQALRRPDLAPFDPNNIEIWIKRIEFAFTRSSVTVPKDKFAFLEKLFHAKDDPRVNSFLWGEHTNERWAEFLAYLRERYGRTRRQEVYSMMNGIPRDGRRPTVHADLIREMTANVTLDDIRKEILLKEVPAEVRQHLADRVDDLDFDGTAKALDKHFDKDGKLKDSNKSASINHVGGAKQPQQQQQQQQQRQPQQQLRQRQPQQQPCQPLRRCQQQQQQQQPSTAGKSLSTSH